MSEYPVGPFGASEFVAGSKDTSGPSRLRDAVTEREVPSVKCLDEATFLPGRDDPRWQRLRDTISACGLAVEKAGHAMMLRASSLRTSDWFAALLRREQRRRFLSEYAAAVARKRGLIGRM